MRQILYLLPFAIVLIYCANKNESIKNKKLDSLSNAVITPEPREKENKDIETLECTYDNGVADLGKGLIISPSKFDIYSDSLLTKKLITVDMYAQADEKMPVCPKFFKPDYGIMHFICLAETEKSYKVLANTSEVMFLPRAKGYEFAPWKTIFLIPLA
jgi:hypothetical protein